MKFKVEYEKESIKFLKKLNLYQRKLIIAWVENNLVGTENPRVKGKALKGNLKNYWRYRVGNYRLICDINDLEVKILIIKIGHRKNIY